MSELAATIRSARFPTTRFGRSYLMADVDDFLDRLARTAEAGEPLGSLVAETRFATTSLREGYDIECVDDFLQQVVSGSAAG